MIFAPMFSGRFLLNPRRKAQTFLGAACVGYIDFLIFCQVTSNSQTGRLRKAWLSHGWRIHAGCVAHKNRPAEYARKSYIRSLKRREKSAPFCDYKKKRPGKSRGAKIILNPMRKDFQMGMEGSLAGCSRFRCKQRRGT